MRPMLNSRILPGLTVPIANPVGETRLTLLRELALHLGLEIEFELTGGTQHRTRIESSRAVVGGCRQANLTLVPDT